MRSGVHAFPFSVPAAVYGRYLLLLALSALALAIPPEPQVHRTFRNFALAVAVLCSIGVASSELVPVRTLLQLQLLRSTKRLTFLVLLYVGHLISVSWGWGTVARVGAVASFLGLWLEQPGLLALALAFYLLGAPARWRVETVGFGSVALVAGAWSGAVAFSERMGLQQLTSHLRDILADPLVAACLALLILLRACERSSWRERTVRWLTAAAVAAGVLPALYRGSTAAAQAEPWNEVQAWCRENTPKETVFLTPPYREGFRVFSERAVVGEWKDGTQQFFATAFTLEWYRRMEALGAPGQAYDDFRGERLVTLGRTYGAHYAVVPAGSAAALPRVYENAEFAVLLLPAASEHARAGPPP